MLPVVLATRYVAPLREGGSLPGLVEADDLGTYVMKFRGAGQGLKALVAEVIVGELARSLGIRVPDLRAITLDGIIARYEPDQEVQDLLSASVGMNLGIDYLPGSFGYAVGYSPDPVEAAHILWLDSFVANVDRSWQNPNLLIWHRQLWAIDHGAALYFHHAWPGGVGDPQRFALQPYDARQHVLGAYAAGVAEADATLGPQVTAELLMEVLQRVPDEWLEPAPDHASPNEIRSAYQRFLLARLAGSRPWLPTEVSP